MLPLPRKAFVSRFSSPVRAVYLSLDGYHGVETVLPAFDRFYNIITHEKESYRTDAQRSHIMSKCIIQQSQKKTRFHTKQQISSTSLTLRNMFDFQNVKIAEKYAYQTKNLN